MVTYDKMQEETYGVTNRQRHWKTYSDSMGGSPETRLVVNGAVYSSKQKRRNGWVRTRETHNEFTRVGEGDPQMTERLCVCRKAQGLKGETELAMGK